MSRWLLTIHNERDREKAAKWLARLPFGWRVQFMETKRSIPQNDRMWAMLTEISVQLVWHGQRYSSDDWKDYFMHALNGGRWMPAEDGGMIPIGRSTSKLGKQEHTMLQDIIQAFAERHGVIIKNPKEDAADETEGGAVPQPASDPPSVREPAHPGELIRTREGAMEYARRWGAYYLSLPKDREEEFIIETEATVKIAIGLNPTAQDPISDALNAPKEIVA